MFDANPGAGRGIEFQGLLQIFFHQLAAGIIEIYFDDIDGMIWISIMYENSGIYIKGNNHQ